MKRAGLAGRLGDRLLAIAFRLLDLLGRLAARPRHHLAREGAGLVLDALGVLLGGVDVEEGLAHLRRRLHGDELHDLDDDAGAVGVERLLDDVLDLGGDAAPARS